MSEFKCISCGTVKESKKSCNCPNCGYRMFQSPYDRKSILITEIKHFISRLEVTTVTRDDLIFVGKDKDDKRFPDFDKVLKYVSQRERTEDFLYNLLETVEQLKLHYTSEFSKTYTVSFDMLENIIEQYDEVLIEAASVLAPETSVELPPVQWDNVSLLYSETQNKYLWFSVNELLDLTEKLAKKSSVLLRSITYTAINTNTIRASKLINIMKKPILRTNWKTLFLTRKESFVKTTLSISWRTVRPNSKKC